VEEEESIPLALGIQEQNQKTEPFFADEEKVSFFFLNWPS